VKANATFKALADPTRREILRLLAGRDMSAGEIAAGFAMSKPSISHHLGVLRQASLVIDERRGQSIIYSLNTTVFQDVLSWMAGVAAGKSPGRPGGRARTADPGGAEGRRRR
jgi:DNA-binding transcriptional ArsR family regulator